MAIDPSQAGTTATTPFGAVSVRAEGSAGATIRAARVELPGLPDGMAVGGIFLFSIRVAGPVTRELPLRLEVSVDRDGAPEPGQWLESMAFAGDDGVLQVATHDSEWLAAKGIVAEHVHYASRGFTQLLWEAPAGTVLHVSVAWSVDEGAAPADDFSPWFAADLALPG